MLALAACAAPPAVDPEAVPGPRDLALHIVEVNSEGRGDIVSLNEVVSIEASFLKDVGDVSDIVICEAADKSYLILASVREQFKCVMRNAIKKYKNFVKKESSRCSVANEQCEEPPLKLLFYFNGGLVSTRDTLETAETSYRDIERDGIYPVYMIWPTAGIDTYLEDAKRVRAGRLYKMTDPLYLLGVRQLSDLLRGLASAPAAWATSAFQFSQTGFGFGSEAYMTKRDWELHVSQGQPLGTGTVEIKPTHNLYFSPWQQEFGPPADFEALPDGEPMADLLFRDGMAQDPGAATSFAYKLATAPVRILTTALTVGFGEAGWRNMVRRTRTSVRAVAEFSGEFAEPSESFVEGRCVALVPEELQRCFPRGSGGFALVFQWLQSCMTGQAFGPRADYCPLEDLPPEDRETLRDARIVMIGHSMGTIVINELLQLFPDLPYESLVYMAGAASVRDTSKAVAPVLTANRGCTKFYGLMLHPMNEARESTGWGLLPLGSLLVWVDEFLEVPKTVPDRTVGQWRNLRAARHVFFPEAARQWMLFRVFDRAGGMRRLDDVGGDPTTQCLNNEDGCYSNPTTHGAFNDVGVPFWKKQFWKPDQISFAEPEADCAAFFTSRLQSAD